MGTDAKTVVRVSIEERVLLVRALQAPRVAKDRVLRINLLLKTDAVGLKWPDSRIAEAYNVSTGTVARLARNKMLVSVSTVTRNAGSDRDLSPQ
jgi:hypothetical protein